MADKPNSFGAPSKKSELDKQKNLSNRIIEVQVKLKNDEEYIKNLNQFKKELHGKRLEHLREEANKLKDDAWKYPQVDKLLGL